MYKETSHDVDLKYSNTIVGVTQEGGVVFPFSVQGSLGSHPDIKLMGKLLSNGTWKDYEIKVSSPKLFLRYPDMGNINLKNSYIFIERGVKKQYRKTLAKGIIRIIDPFYREREIIQYPRVRDVHNKSIYMKLFNPSFPAMKESYKLVETGKALSSAFSPCWGFGISMRNDNILLYKDELSIGEMKGIDKVKINKALVFLYEQIEEINLKVV